jgi:exopolysaccharide biosynthesis WecB/TagA/CpsF family protein
MNARYGNMVKVLNIDIDDVSMQELLDGRVRPRFLIPVNVDVLMKLQKDSEFFGDVSRHRDETCICLDSQIIRLAVALILGKSFQEKISGSDFFPAFCNYHAENPDVRIFLAGAMEGVAHEAGQQINKRVGREIIVATASPPFGFEKDEQESEKLVQRINDSGATVLALGVGAPKQEKWIYRYAARLPGISFFMAVGATIDFEAGNVSRAPAWINHIGLEWLYRLALEPRRLTRRYLVDDIPFFWHLLTQRMGRYSTPFGGHSDGR